MKGIHDLFRPRYLSLRLSDSLLPRQAAMEAGPSTLFGQGWRAVESFDDVEDIDEYETEEEVSSPPMYGC